MSNPNQYQSLSPSAYENPQATLSINAHPANGGPQYHIAELPDSGDGEFKIRPSELFDLVGDAKPGDEIVFGIVQPQVLALADNRILVNEAEHTVAVDNKLRHFGNRNFEVLRTLAKRPDTILSWEWIAEEVWPDSSPEKFDRARDNIGLCITRIREVLGPELRDVIRTYPARGYCALSGLLDEVTILNGDCASAVHSFADDRIQVNEGDYTVVVDNSLRAISLMPYTLLRMLAEKVGNVVSMREIAEELWQARSPEEVELWHKNIHVQVNRIRNVVGPELRGAICNYRGVGYYVLASLPKDVTA